MSYKITLRDKSEMIVPDDAGTALQEHLLSLKKPEYLEIGDNTYNSSQITSITKTNLAGGAGNQPQITAPQYNCVKANTSIQAEIHRRAMRDRKNWTNLVRDPAWREQMRKSILAEDPKRAWCDGQSAIHVCTPT